jgi:hypothetical protein
LSPILDLVSVAKCRNPETRFHFKTIGLKFGRVWVNQRFGIEKTPSQKAFLYNTLQKTGSNISDGGLLKPAILIPESD